MEKLLFCALWAILMAFSPAGRCQTIGQQWIHGVWHYQRAVERQGAPARGVVHLGRFFRDYVLGGSPGAPGVPDHDAAGAE